MEAIVKYLMNSTGGVYARISVVSSTTSLIPKDLLTGYDGTLTNQLVTSSFNTVTQLKGHVHSIVEKARVVMKQREEVLRQLPPDEVFQLGDIE